MYGVQQYADIQQWGHKSMRYLRLLWVFVRLGIVNEMAYRANFFVQLLQSLIQLGTALVGLVIVFAHISRLGGWRPEELLALLGVYLLGDGAMNLVLQPSMQQLTNDIQQGTLDYTLTKPEDAQLLVSIQRIDIWSSVNIALGAVVLTLALIQSGTHIEAAQALTFTVTLLASGAIIYSFWLMLATCAFWFVRFESILSIFWIMYRAGRWPISIYPTWLRVLLTFVIPVGIATTIPVEALLDHLTWGMLAGMMILSVAMLVGSRWFWRIGVRRYSGASA